MTFIKLLTAPIRRLVGMPLFQFCVVVLIVFLLQAAPDGRLVAGTVQTSFTQTAA